MSDLLPTIRIAVASRDGRLVQQHFGQATQFLIYELADGIATLVETRKSTPPCDPVLREHDEGRMRGLLELVADCQVVLAALIGPGAVALLQQKGIKAISAPGFIDVVFARLCCSGVLPGAIKKEEQE